MLGRSSAAQRPLAVAAREPERSQLLLGLGPDPGYRADVAELPRLITGRAGLPAAVIADRIRAAVDDFAAVPPHDDVAVLVLAARPGPLISGRSPPPA